LNHKELDYSENKNLPPLWHWLYFLPIFRLSEAGYDGHAALGDFLPPVPLPRRMWAGSRIKFLAPLKLGNEYKKISTIKSVSAKSGRSGNLVFVTVTHEVSSEGSICINEEHDIVYREKATSSSASAKLLEAPKEFDFSNDINPDPVLLFRYSALTFNGHRIHYDHPFCTETEGYDGLVVHGPLLATLLLDGLAGHKPNSIVQNFEFRAMAPVFDHMKFKVRGKQIDKSEYSLWIEREDGSIAMSAKAKVK
ncbi:MAG: acyl-CoA dehydrogenase, partial [Alphaproteobacteria bacterium]|nr:acyl-CoA dehydrogenase [Alphaproteobacteria bacterium]